MGDMSAETVRNPAAVGAIENFNFRKEGLSFPNPGTHEHRTVVARFKWLGDRKEWGPERIQEVLRQVVKDVHTGKAENVSRAIEERFKEELLNVA